MNQSEHFSRSELNRRLAILAEHLAREVDNLDPEDDDHDREGVEDTQRILWSILSTASDLSSAQVQAYLRDDDLAVPKVPRAIQVDAEYAYGAIRMLREVGRRGPEAGRN